MLTVLLPRVAACSGGCGSCHYRGRISGGERSSGVEEVILAELAVEMGMLSSDCAGHVDVGRNSTGLGTTIEKTREGESFGTRCECRDAKRT